MNRMQREHDASRIIELLRGSIKALDAQSSHVSDAARCSEYVVVIDQLKVGTLGDQSGAVAFWIMGRRVEGSIIHINVLHKVARQRERDC